MQINKVIQRHSTVDLKSFGELMVSYGESLLIGSFLLVQFSIFINTGTVETR
jgi:hypothetical protein